MSKLTEEQERELIEDFREGATVSECMAEFKIERFEVEQIIRREVLRIQKEEGV